jgi:hypothetical protein
MSGERPFSFEFHKLSGESVSLISFVSRESAAALGSPENRSGREVVLSPRPWEEAAVLLSVPADRIVSVTPRQIELGPDGRGKPKTIDGMYSMFVLDAMIE